MFSSKKHRLTATYLLKCLLTHDDDKRMNAPSSSSSYIEEICMRSKQNNIFNCKLLDVSDMHAYVSELTWLSCSQVYFFTVDAVRIFAFYHLATIDINWFWFISMLFVCKSHPDFSSTSSRFPFEKKILLRFTKHLLSKFSPLILIDYIYYILCFVTWKTNTKGILMCCIEMFRFQ